MDKKLKKAFLYGTPAGSPPLRNKRSPRKKKTVKTGNSRTKSTETTGNSRTKSVKKSKNTVLRRDASGKFIKSK